MKLAANFAPIVNHVDSCVARITRNPSLTGKDRLRHVLLSNNDEDVEGFAAVLMPGGEKPTTESIIPLPEELSYLEDGDIIRINFRAGQIRVLYRKSSDYNVLFFTERCNSRCIMCSQPPRVVDDTWLVDDIMESLSLMSPGTRQLCITGGEPTLLFNRLIEVVSAAKEKLPKTSLHMLSNGRLYSYLKLAKSLADVKHPDLMVGIPLYSDIPSQHNYIVQAQNAFDHTMLGFMNLARVGVRTELRIVLHKQSCERLPEISKFILRNLPFVSHIAFMGLEPIGFGKSNIQHLWIDPLEYQSQLKVAVECLANSGLCVSIYNVQRCLLPAMSPE